MKEESEVAQPEVDPVNDEYVKGFEAGCAFAMSRPLVAAENAAKEVVDEIWGEAMKLAQSFVDANARNYNDHKGVESLERVYDAKRDTAQQIVNQMKNFNEARWHKPSSIIAIISKYSIQPSTTSASTTAQEAEQTWCDHCSADLNGVKHILCERCYREYAGPKWFDPAFNAQLSDAATRAAREIGEWLRTGMVKLTATRSRKSLPLSPDTTNLKSPVSRVR